MTSRVRRSFAFSVFAALVALALLGVASPQRLAAQNAAPSRVLDTVDDASRVTLAGNTHPLARAEFDRGPVSPSTPMARMLLVLRRSPQQEAALKQLIDAQQDRTSPVFHQWMTPQEFGSQFGPSDRDLSILTRWLGSHGFASVHVNSGRTVVEFSGTAAQVQAAFHTSMRRYEVSGVEYTANASDPQIPAALAPVVAGFASLNNFPTGDPSHTAQLLERDAQTHQITRLGPGQANSTAGQPQAAASANQRPSYTGSANGQATYAVTPYDFAAIYNVSPLWSAGTPIDGTGQTIAVAGQSDINSADFLNFRKLFNLPLGATNTPTGTQYLNVIYNGANPGANADEAKADAGTQWAGAIAKSATIDYVASQTTQATKGIDLSATYIVDNNLAPVMTYSDAQCEATAGSGFNSFISNLWSQAAAQGITVLVASGDSGSAGCDAPGSPAASGGLAVNAAASTPYDVAVGGTDFYMPSGGGAYWNSGNDPTTQASAKGYVPEAVWNDSCANADFASMQPYTGMTPQQVCNDPAAAQNGLLTVLGGGGGASTSNSQPSWQTGSGVPSNSARNLPDVSLFAGDGAFGTFYALCQQSADPTATACSVGTATTRFSGDGGTAFSSAAMAGVLALVNQKTGQRQGNANYVLYNLASQQAKGGASCDSTGSPSASCIFHDVTKGSNAMPCVAGSPSCDMGGASGNYGVLSGFAAASGYDQATGLGSVDVANLVNGWSNAAFIATTTTLALSATSITHGSPVTATVNVTSGNGTPTGDVSVNAAAANGSLGGGTLASGSFSNSYSDFPGGTYPVTAHYAGDGTFAASDSQPVYLTVAPEASTTTLTITNQDGQSPATAPYGNIFDLRASVTSLSGQGVATGNANYTNNGAVLYGGVYRLNSQGIADVVTNSFSPGNYSFVASYGGDPSLEASQSAAVGLIITKAPTTATVTSSVAAVSAGSTVTFSATVNTTGYGQETPSGILLFQSGSTVIGSSTLTPGKGSHFDFSTATLTVAANTLPMGPNQITVNFQGDTNYLPSTSGPASLTVTPSTQTATGTSLTLTPNSVPLGGTITFTVTVAGSAGGAAPTGTVQLIVDGQNVLGPMKLSGGTVSFPATFAAPRFAAGMHTAVAVYSGDATYKSSTSSSTAFTLTSGTAADGVSVTLNPTTAVQGTSVLVSVNVTPASPVATGTVQLLLDGSADGAPITLDSAASAKISLATKTLQAGTHSITIFYSGDAFYGPAYSGPQTLTITLPGSTLSQVTLSSLPVTVNPGQNVSFGATVTPTTPAATGVLQTIVDGGQPSTPITLTSEPTQLSVPTTGLALGNHTVVVYYSGDTNYSFAYSAKGTFTIAPFTPSFSIASTTTVALIPPGSPATSASDVLTITPLHGFTGTVSFSCGNLPTGVTCVFAPTTVTLDGTSVATTSLTFVNGATASLAVPDGPFQQRGGRNGWGLAGGGAALAGLLLLSIPRRRRGWAALAILLVFAAAGAVSGCGSGGVPPRGPYAVAVTATGGTVTQTTTMNVTIE